MENNQFYGCHKFIVAALNKTVNENTIKLDDPNIRYYEFSDSEKFQKYIMADFIYEISKKCNADWLDDYEEQILFPETLPLAIQIVDRAIKQRKNTEFKDYLEQTKELMEIALQNETFMGFLF